MKSCAEQHQREVEGMLPVTNQQACTLFMCPYKIKDMFSTTEMKNLHNEVKNTLQETHKEVESALKVLLKKIKHCSRVCFSLLSMNYIWEGFYKLCLNMLGCTYRSEV